MSFLLNNNNFEQRSCEGGIYAGYIEERTIYNAKHNSRLAMVVGAHSMFVEGGWMWDDNSGTSRAPACAEGKWVTRLLLGGYCSNVCLLLVLHITSHSTEKSQHVLFTFIFVLLTEVHLMWRWLLLRKILEENICWKWQPYSRNIGLRKTRYILLNPCVSRISV